MKTKFIAPLLAVLMLTLWATPALAIGLGISPPAVEFDVPANASTEVVFKVYHFSGDLSISTEGIPLKVEPTTIPVVAEASGMPITLTFYGDEDLGNQTYHGYIKFLGMGEGNVGVQIKVKATVNHVAGGEPLPETPPEESPAQTTPEESKTPPPGESPPPQESRGLPIGGIIGIAAGTIIVITLIVVLARRSRY